MSGLIDSHVNRELDAFRATVLQNVCSGCVVWLHLRAWTVAVGFQSCARWLCGRVDGCAHCNRAPLCETQSYLINLCQAHDVL